MLLFVTPISSSSDISIFKRGVSFIEVLALLNTL
jgi:hypothetical protein